MWKSTIVLYNILVQVVRAALAHRMDPFTELSVSVSERERDTGDTSEMDPQQAQDVELMLV